MPKRRPRKEIDRVISTDGVPTFDDDSKLPYVSTLSKEAFRWQQVAPFGMPLRASLKRLSVVPKRPVSAAIAVT
jgi:Cytochrome P450